MSLWNRSQVRLGREKSRWCFYSVSRNGCDGPDKKINNKQRRLLLFDVVVVVVVVKSGGETRRWARTEKGRLVDWGVTEIGGGRRA